MKFNRSIFLYFLFLVSCQDSTLRFYTFYYETEQIFEFKKNGKYIYKRAGHWGDCASQGNYLVRYDTIILLNDICGISKKYLLTKDKRLIDLEETWDFVLMTNKYQYPEYGGKQNNIKYPNVPTKTKTQEKDMDETLDLIFNTPEITKYIPENIVFRHYLYLNNKIKIGNKIIPFTSDSTIENTNTPHIKFKDINQNEDNIKIYFWIIKNKKKLLFYCESTKIKGKWAGKWEISNNHHSTEFLDIEISQNAKKKK